MNPPTNPVLILWLEFVPEHVQVWILLPFSIDPSQGESEATWGRKSKLTTREVDTLSMVCPCKTVIPGEVELFQKLVIKRKGW